MPTQQPTFDAAESVRLAKYFREAKEVHARNMDIFVIEKVESEE